ncbi:hypothetical protein, partial [Allorhizocola rhizosphaerae]|uniref:hypothetical protein n=1 Tax=Allorhizocola rhizosphaerae TaxID=1872709 RepID=UPI001B8BA265
MPAALVAIGAGAGFGNPLFSLPALTSLRYRSIELTWLLLPTVAAVMLAIAIAAAPRFRGRGYLLTAVGALVGGLGIFLADERIGGASATVAWVLVTAASGGLAAGGLAVAAGCVSGPERLAIGAGLAAGIAAS